MTSEEFKQKKAEQIRRIAAKGRTWIEAEAKEAKAALARQRTEGRKDGTVACIVAEIEDFRAAWKLAA